MLSNEGMAGPALLQAMQLDSYCRSTVERKTIVPVPSPPTSYAPLQASRQFSPSRTIVTLAHIPTLGHHGLGRIRSTPSFGHWCADSSLRSFARPAEVSDAFATPHCPSIHAQLIPLGRSFLPPPRIRSAGANPYYATRHRIGRTPAEVAHGRTPLASQTPLFVQQWHDVTLRFAL